MTALEQAVLDHLAGGPTDMAALVATRPRGSVYRTLRRLVKRGLVVQAGPSAWALTQPGQEAMGTPVTPPPPGAPAFVGPPAPRLPFPHLDLAPVPLYRQFLELVMLAVASRFYGLRPGHHPSFVVVGPRLKWKTWIARAACIMTDVDQQTGVIPLMNESGRSLTSRRNARGERVTLRRALDQAVVGLDEWTRTTPEVRRLAQVYTHGLIDCPDEDQTLRVRSTPLILTNPVEGAADLPARILMDDALIRRSVVMDVAGVTIPPEVLAEGEVLLERMAGLGPIEIPPVPDPSWEPRAEVHAAVLAAIDVPERLALIDVVLIAQLVTSATRWLARAEALRLVLLSYFAIVETLGWMRTDWRVRVEEILGGGEEPMAEAPVEEVVEDVEPLDLDYEARLMSVDRALQDAGVELADLPALLADGAALRRHGLRVADLHGLRVLAGLVRGRDGDAEARVRVLAVMDELRLTATDARRLLAVAAAGRDVLRLDVEDVMLLLRGVEEAGLEPAEVGAWAVETLDELGRLEGQLAVVQEEVCGWEQRRLAAAEDVALLQRRVRALARVLERAEAEPELAASLGLAERELGSEAIEEVLALAREFEGAGRAGS